MTDAAARQLEAAFPAWTFRFGLGSLTHPLQLAGDCLYIEKPVEIHIGFRHCPFRAVVDVHDDGPEGWNRFCTAIAGVEKELRAGQGD